MDLSHAKLDYSVPEIEHCYSSKVHILSDPHIRTLLARLCNWSTVQPEINHLVDEIYRGMLAIAIGAEFPREEVSFKTRMYADTTKGVFQGEVVSSETLAVTVAMARAGILPSGICYSQLLHFLKPQGVRQDYFHLQRTVDENDHVTGAEISGAKVGGPINNAVVVIPDPMGATAISMCEVVQHYKEKVEGKPIKFIVVHLIIVPEYLIKLHQEHPEVIVYAARIDRGMSPPDALESMPGENPTEKGLNEKGYIIPGAGGLGEILNNSFV